MTHRKLNLLHINLFLDMGGLESIIMDLCKHIDRRRYAPAILCLQGYDPLYKEAMEKQGVPVYLIEKRHKLDFAFFGRIRDLIREKRIDIVHIHSGCFFNGSLSALLAGVKAIVYTAHGMPVETGFQARVEDRIAARITHKIVAVSDEIEDHLRKQLHSAHGKIGKIINGIDTDKYYPPRPESVVAELRKEFDIPQGRFVIGSVGRLEDVKNYSMLLRAFALLTKEYQGAVHLVLIGDGSRMDDLQGLAEELGITASTSFLGMQYGLHRILPLLDCFVLSSLTEGTSVSLLEAQATAIPAVVTRVGGNVKIVQDGFNGYLCDLNDIESMARKLALLCSDPQHCRELGNNSRTLVEERYSLKAMIASYETEYQALAN